MRFERDKVIIYYTDRSKHTGIAEVRPDYLKYEDVYQELVSKRNQLQGTLIQIIGLPLKDGTLLATNVAI